jgi:hypothetical protein
MTDTATTANEINTHFFGDMMTRDGAAATLASATTVRRRQRRCHNCEARVCYCTLASIPHTMDTRGALVLDDALDQVADASTPRAPVDLPFTVAVTLTHIWTPIWLWIQ